MKGLRQFLRFDFDGFCAGKRFVATDCRPWTDHDSGKVVGTRVEVAITADGTSYATGKDGKTVSNLFEKMVWKLPKNVDIPTGTVVAPIGGTATVYGDYMNQLSVVLTDIRRMQPTQSPAAPNGVKH